MPQRAELNYAGWRLTIAPQRDKYEWWLLSPRDDGDPNRIIHSTAYSFESALHEAHRTLQAQLGHPVPKPTLLETP